MCAWASMIGTHWQRAVGKSASPAPATQQEPGMSPCSALSICAALSCMPACMALCTCRHHSACSSVSPSMQPACPAGSPWWALPADSAIDVASLCSKALFTGWTDCFPKRQQVVQAAKEAYEPSADAPMASSAVQGSHAWAPQQRLGMRAWWQSVCSSIDRPRPACTWHSGDECAFPAHPALVLVGLQPRGHGQGTPLSA